MIFNFEIYCLHGLEELISNNVIRVEIPPLYAKLHCLDTWISDRREISRS